MTINDRDFLNFFEWLLPNLENQNMGAIVFFLSVVSLFALLSILICYLVAASRSGPVEGFYSVAKTLFSAITEDLPHLSPRRIWAMARLAMQESIRKWVLVVFAVFMVIILFAGWFLEPNSENPSRLYLGFVLTSSNYLILSMALFLSAFSLPNDIKFRTIYTVVTKPVRPGEILLGRVLGFSLIGTAILMAMGVVSYVFVVRGLNHSHEITAADLVEEKLPDGTSVLKGFTTLNSNHRHEVTIYENGEGQTDIKMGHWHEVVRSGQGENATYKIGPPIGSLQARVPHFPSKITYLDRSGRPGEGLSVGDEWNYRKYIEGKTQAAAVWSFEGITEKEFADGIPIELKLGVFRTYMGNIEKGVQGLIYLENPSPDAKVKKSEPRPFTSVEFQYDRHFIPRKLKSLDNQEIDLFADLVSDGKLNIVLQCDDANQYLGMAKGDLYVHKGDVGFALNFSKGLVLIWLQMLMVISFGVMYSTFLSGPVAMLATMTSVILGFCSSSVSDLFNKEVDGGGPIEAAYRIVTQKNVMSELDLGYIPATLIQAADTVFIFMLQASSHLLPRFQDFIHTSSKVADGFDISGNSLAIHLAIAFGTILASTIVGFFFLKTREIAA